ncbi:MAG: hypothetical protein ACTHV2_09630 [Brachybacterium sp.]
MGYFAQIAKMPETTKLYDTVVTWRDAIEVHIVTGATTGIKNIKRTGHGSRTPENYRTRPAGQRLENRRVFTLPNRAFTTHREEPSKP